MRATPSRLESLIAPLEELRRRALELEQRFADELARIPAEHRPSARNLLHDLALRQHDLRPLSVSRVTPFVGRGSFAHVAPGYTRAP